MSKNIITLSFKRRALNERTVTLLFLLLEEDDIVCMENVVALIRDGNETAILMRNDTVRATGFTPPTLRKRSERFWKDCVQWKEQIK